MKQLRISLLPMKYLAGGRNFIQAISAFCDP